jgi:uncharacterized protein YigE (DUF2233 family)
MKFRHAAALVLLAVPAFAANRSVAACDQRMFESSRFTVCTFDSTVQDLELALTDTAGKPLRSFARLATGARAVRFAMNAGMFEASGRPVGLYIEHGLERHQADVAEGEGNFFLKPNGVFSAAADGTLRIETTAQFLDAKPQALWATQSGPMLVIDGQLHPKIAPDGASLNIRNGVGIRSRTTAVFAISDDPVSFGRMARLFRDDLHCQNALYLDGAVSSLWWPAIRRRDARAPLGPMFVVFDKRT